MEPTTSNYYFIVSALVIYERDGENKQRPLNVLTEMDQPNITKADLGSIQRTVTQRINSENGVTPDQVKDVVILNICLLGLMDPKVFHAEPNETLDQKMTITP